MEIVPKTIRLKAYSLAALAAIYEIDYRTLKKWMEPFEEEIGPRRGRLYQIPQVRIIFQRLELPAEIIIKD